MKCTYRILYDTTPSCYFVFILYHYYPHYFSINIKSQSDIKRSIYGVLSRL